MFPKILTFLLFGLFLTGAATAARAAIAVENTNSVSNFTLGGVRTTINVPLAVPGINRAIYVGVSNFRTPATVLAPCTATPLPMTGSVSSVTYNGQNFTRLTTAAVGGFGAVVAPDFCSSVEIFRLTGVNVPPGGTADVIVTQPLGGDYLVIGAAALTGVDQTAATAGALLAASGASNTPSLTATTANGNLVLDVIAANFAAGLTNPTMGQIEQWRGVFDGLRNIGGGATKSATSSLTTVNWSLVSSDPTPNYNWAIGATILKPPAATASPASVGGRVTRNQTAPIAAAQVTLQDISTGEIYTTVTDENGRYFFDALEITHLYRIRITHERYIFADGERNFNLFQSIENLDFDGRIGRQRGFF